MSKKYPIDTHFAYHNILFLNLKAQSFSLMNTHKKYTLTHTHIFNKYERESVIFQKCVEPILDGPEIKY